MSNILENIASLVETAATTPITWKVVDSDKMGFRGARGVWYAIVPSDQSILGREKRGAFINALIKNIDIEKFSALTKVGRVRNIRKELSVHKTEKVGFYLTIGWNKHKEALSYLARVARNTTITASNSKPSIKIDKNMSKSDVVKSIKSLKTNSKVAQYIELKKLLDSMK